MKMLKLFFMFFIFSSVVLAMENNGLENNGLRIQVDDEIPLEFTGNTIARDNNDSGLPVWHANIISSGPQDDCVEYEKPTKFFNLPKNIKRLANTNKPNNLFANSGCGRLIRTLNPGASLRNLNLMNQNNFENDNNGGVPNIVIDDTRNTNREKVKKHPLIIPVCPLHEDLIKVRISFRT